MSNSRSTKLHGVDGSQLWGFMCALGTLNLLDEEARARGAAAPRLAFDGDSHALLETDFDDDALVTACLHALTARRAYYEGPLRGVACPKSFTEDSFQILAEVADGWQAQALAGLACSTGVGIHESTLCAANGSGHQYLVQSIRDVLALVDAPQLHAALFAPWTRDYEIPADRRVELGLGNRKPTLRLDPADERIYALRADNPNSKAAAFKTELGAQALAVPAFELLPAVPGKKPRCIASRPARQRVYFEWCLWTPFMTSPSIRSLLAIGPSDRAALQARGASAAFRSARVVGDKGKLSMAPTCGIW